MTKESGLGATLAVDNSASAAKSIENDNLSVDFGTPRGVIDSTGIDSSAAERILALADFSITMSGLFNDAADQSHDVFKTIPSTSVARAITIVHSGQTLTIVGAVLTDYSFNRGPDGSLAWSVPGLHASTTVPTWS